MGDSEQVDFFVSYTTADRPWAEWIAWSLEEAGYSVRVQAWDFVPGANWVLEMDQGASVSRRTLAVLSPAFLESRYAQPEWAAALRDDPDGRMRKLLPVRVRECDPRGLLGSVVYVDLVGLSRDAARDRLLSAAGATRSKPTEPPAFPQVPAGDAVALPGDGPSIWNVPSVAGRFVGRDALLDQLADRLAAGDAAALTQVQTLHGLGGVGKTRAAVEFARRQRASYDVVWWVRSEDPVTRLGDYAALADALALPEREQREQEARAVAVKAWLERNGRWLLIFDNAPEPTALHDLLPNGGGHVLITSRQHGGWRGIADAYAVDVWPRSESVAFLQQRSGDDDPAAADAIAEALGDLPLALEQAGAYVDSAQVSLAGYQRRLETQAPTLFTRGQPADYAHTVATTWDLAFQALEHNQTSAALLFCCAYLAPEQIPRSLFVNEHIADGRFAAPGGEVDLDDAIRDLLAFSLVSAQQDDLSMHRLVQHVIRDRLRDRTWFDVALRLVFDAFPAEGDDHRTWRECEQLLPHALAVTGHALDRDLATPGSAVVMSLAARYLTARVELGAAEELFRGAAAIEEKAYGPDHPRVASMLSNLGIVLTEKGDLQGAREQQERALAITEHAYGPGHPAVAATLTNLGVVLDGMGDPERAREHQQRALAIKESVYGPDHPEVASTLGNIGTLLSGAGDLDAALRHQRRALGIRENAYGPDHSEVAMTLGNIGNVLEKMGDLEGAREHQERALAIEERVFGPDHPEVAATLDNLAVVLVRTGDLEGAREHSRRALVIKEEAYGPEHPGIAQTLNNLGVVADDMGDLERAREYHERALAIRLEAYGPDHPQVAMSLRNLGDVLEQLGHTDGARVHRDRATQITDTASYDQ